MEITFASPKEIVVIPQQKQIVDKITIFSIHDYPEKKLVQANSREIGVILLWQGESYDAIGQWTDTDVINRINELYA